MNLANLVKTQANKVLGIDASTNSVAFCLMENDKPIKWGKIEFVGADIFEKIHDAKNKMHAKASVCRLSNEIQYPYYHPHVCSWSDFSTKNSCIVALSY